MLLSIEDYAKHCGLPSSTVRKMVKRKDLPAMMVSGKWWLDIDGADQVIKSECAKNVGEVVKPTNNKACAFIKQRQRLFN